MSASGREAEQGLEQRWRADQSRALAAEHRARAHELRAGVNAGDDGARPKLLRQASASVLRAREQRRLATAACVQIAGQDGTTVEPQQLRAERHEAWAEVQERLALAQRLRGEGLTELAETSAREAERLRSLAQAAQERVSAAERRGVVDAAA